MASSQVNIDDPIAVAETYSLDLLLYADYDTVLQRAHQHFDAHFLSLYRKFISIRESLDQDHHQLVRACSQCLAFMQPFDSIED